MKPEVVIMGLGYIGLPTSALISSKKVNVLGVDTNDDIVNKVNNGQVHIIEQDLEKVVKYSVKNNFLKASIRPQSANVFLIVVPTPFKGNHEPDISYIKSATLDIIPFLKEEDLYIIESTSPIGTTQKMKELIYSKREDLKDKLNIAYCPERVLPGNIMHELVNNDRVIGGVDEKSTKKAIEFYSKFVTGKLHSTNDKTAEMCKLVENSSRDVQIAFANELSLLCDKAGIDVWKLIDLANMHPRVNILKPGCGVGGHCIAVDPYFIVSNYPLESKIIAKAREINNYKSFWCVEKILNSKLKYKADYGKDPVIAIMGLSFKPNIDDLRESPAMYIANKINDDCDSKKTLFVEPNIKTHKQFKLTNSKEAVDSADIIVFLVAHNEFKNIEIVSSKFVLDFCGLK
jgi:UDP-N-acetyl-D-mannosaminuronic acid dehydrogenase